MMVDKQADLVVNLEADKVTKEKRKVDQEQDEGSATVTMMMTVILIVDGELMDTKPCCRESNNIDELGKGHPYHTQPFTLSKD